MSVNVRVTFTKDLSTLLTLSFA